MPGLLNVANGFANTLRVSLRFSRFLDHIAEAIRDDAVFERSHGTMRDPTYVTRDREGNIKRYWRTDEDEKRQKKLEQYCRVMMEGMKFLKPEWYKQREGMIENESKYQPYNFLKLIAQAQTDLIAGGGVNVETNIEQLDNLLNEEMEIGESIYEWLFESACLGFVGIQVLVDKEAGTLELQRILPQFLFVTFPKTKDNDWTCISKKVPVSKSEIRDWREMHDMKNTGQGTGFDGFVFEERHFKGYYENYLWAVKGNEIIKEVPLEYYKPDLKRVVVTGLQDFAIVVIPNRIVMGTFQSEWDGIIDHNLNFNDRASREGELLNKYAGPQLMISENQVAFDASTGKTFYRVPREGHILIRPQDNFTPEYLQPQADIQGSETNRKFILNMIATESQTAPMLLNAEESASIDTGVAYKMKLTPTLAKVNRRKGKDRHSIQRLIFVILSALDYYSDMRIAESVLKQAQMEGATDKLKEQALLIQKFIESNSVRISMDSFQEVFQNVEILATNPVGLFMEDPAKASTPDELNYLLTINQLQHIENRNVAMQAVIRQKDISVTMLPALPQDVAQYVERLGDKPSISLQTFLTEVDGRSDEEADREIKRIQEEEETFTANTGFGYAGEDFPAQDVGDTMGGDQSIQLHEGTAAEEMTAVR